MKVYVVSRICDDEYFCTEVVFVTSDENVAKQYCKENNVKCRCWDGNVRDMITYREYELENEYTKKMKEGKYIKELKLCKGCIEDLKEYNPYIDENGNQIPFEKLNIIQVSIEDCLNTKIVKGD